MPVLVPVHVQVQVLVMVLVPVHVLEQVLVLVLVRVRVQKVLGAGKRVPERVMLVQACRSACA